MSNFYFDLPQRNANHGPQDRVRPMILGLTAGPIYGGNVDKSFASVFKHLLYAAPVYNWENVPSRNHQALQAVVDSLYIEGDPYVKALRQQLVKLPLGDERTRIDQKLSKTIGKQDTFTHRGLKDFARAAQEICLDLGVWAADWYVVEVIKRAEFAADPYNNIMSTWQEKEKRYLLSIISRIQARLVDYLFAEHASAEAQDETYSGLVFVTRRDIVIALAELLSRFPEMAQRFNIGSLLGSSNSFQRHTFLDITRTIPKDSHLEKTLRDFKIGDKNLIISTSVAEEGIDIQACEVERRKKSTFILMFEDGSVQQKLVQQWEEIEARMTALYNDVSRDAAPAPECDDDDDDDPQEYVVESTGAVLTLHSATSHLNYFCAVLPNARHGQGDFLPVYDLDPPEFPEGWHVTRDALPIYEGPWGAKVTLPRAVPKDLRIFSTQRIYKSKHSAQRHAAFRAYVTLHKASLLSDNLLPLTSVVEQDRDGEVKKLLEEVEKRASTAKVSLQVDPWAAPENTNTWWINELSAVDLPTLTFLTRMPITPLSDIDPPPLYLPGPKHVHFRVRPLGVTTDDEDYISKARAYTLRLFSTLYGQRMNPDDTEFTYLFLPAAERSHDAVWETRRQWMEDRRFSRKTSPIQMTWL
ncbi:hypothetical protein OBBRIDRAFT_838546 [Obba rivulosa]|uniref:Dicer dsRNA-binding fold domain-containing protein n=1 Tax=Obba rivulosa TaxID=1052685 RepID=A0A8E2DGH5_9APHY|nr:hypothetical protein OBBRIDRAFT_838546 [Obba rivulosa]